MKKVFLAACAVFTALVLALSFPLSVIAEISDDIALSAGSAVLIDASDGTVLFEKNAHERRGMASTTKIMTALVVADTLPPDRVVAIPKEAVNTEGSSVYLTEGELLSVRELLYALLLSSANDAAVALAIAAAGSVEAFAERMNGYAATLGLCNTHFTNPHGLNDENHYTTAYELAVITREAMKNESLREIFASKSATIPHGVTKNCPKGDTVRKLYNHNKMLKMYDGAIGVKTGFTKATGRCLVSAAEREGLTLIAVTLCAPDDWHDHTAMLDYGFSMYKCVTFYEKGEFKYSFPVVGGKELFVVLTNAQPLSLTLPHDIGAHSEAVYSPHRFEFAPVMQRDTLAALEIKAGGKSVSSPLIALHGVEATKKH